MLALPLALQKLVHELNKLPSIGEKTATRLAYYLVNGKRDLAQTLAEALKVASDKVTFCKQCYFFSEEELCAICRSELRDRSLLCVIEKPADLLALERSAEFKGLYHVLHGLWSPLRGQGPEQIKLNQLLERVKQGGIKEVIIATSSTVEGDATALYLARALHELGVATSRLAQGMPRGGELEYADDLTLARALSGRNVI